MTRLPNSSPKYGGRAGGREVEGKCTSHSPRNPRMFNSIKEIRVNNLRNGSSVHLILTELREYIFSREVHVGPRAAVNLHVIIAALGGKRQTKEFLDYLWIKKEATEDSY